ncbi:hypothetical protein [Fulvivirga marina]|nr:hypothetical protein [Fulvivirga marina]
MEWYWMQTPVNPSVICPDPKMLVKKEGYKDFEIEVENHDGT